MLQLVQERATEIETKLLFVELEWAAVADEHGRGAARAAPSLPSARTTCAARGATARICSPSPRRRSSPRSRSPRARLEPAVRRADGRDPGRPRRRAAVPGGGAQPPAVARPRAARGPSPRRSPRRWPRACARAPSSTTRCCTTRPSTTGCAPTRTGWPSRNLANEASDASVMALIEAVRGRFDIPQRWYRLKAQLLGLDRIADYDRAAPVLPQEITFSFGDAREMVLDVYHALLAGGRRAGPALLRRALDRRPRPRAQARRRLLLLHGAQRAPVRDAQLHRPAPRRADDGPRARSRAARRTGPAPGRLSPVHAADPGRDRLGVR